MIRVTVDLDAHVRLIFSMTLFGTGNDQPKFVVGLCHFVKSSNPKPWIQVELELMGRRKCHRPVTHCQLVR